MHIHFIGIAGSAIAPLAVMVKTLGHHVTGSEHNKVWEPAKSLLQNAGIKYTEQSTNIKNIQDADLIILGGSTILKDKNNAEYLEAKRLGKPIHGFVYLVEKFITKRNSIVVAGTYGKTTTSSAIAWIFEVADKNPSFMIGGKPLNFQSGVNYSSSDVSVVEGDEFVVLPTLDMNPKFIHYNPTTAIITASKWDHIDVYPSEKQYIEAYFKLLDILRKNNGNLIISLNGENNDKLIKNWGKNNIWMLSTNKDTKIPIKNKTAHTILSTFKGFNDDFTNFTINIDNKKIADFQTTMIGLHNIEDLSLAITTAYINGINVQTIQTAIRTFKGISRRQEIRGKTTTGATIIDDFAHSAIKAKATLEAIRLRYTQKKIIALYSPRISDGEDKEVLKWYPTAFDDADFVIIPHIPVKKSTPKENRIHGIDLVKAIRKTQPNVEYMPQDKQIIKYLKDHTDTNSVIVFMAGKSWDNIINGIKE